MEKSINMIFDDKGHRRCCSCMNRRDDIRENNNCCDRCIANGIKVYQQRKESMRVQVVCECGVSVKKYSMKLHLLTKKHKKMMETKNETSSSSSTI